MNVHDSVCVWASLSRAEAALLRLASVREETPGCYPASPRSKGEEQ
jgi:hypothetical protein